jgi:hypothetical protein
MIKDLHLLLLLARRRLDFASLVCARLRVYNRNEAPPPPPPPPPPRLLTAMLKASGAYFLYQFDTALVLTFSIEGRAS